MLYMVEVEAAMERANEIDRGGGPGEMFAKVIERFRPQSVWGDPTGRHAFLVVELETPAISSGRPAGTDLEDSLQLQSLSGKFLMPDPKSLLAVDGRKALQLMSVLSEKLSPF